MPGKTAPPVSWSMGIDVPRGPLEEALFERILQKLGRRPLAWVLPASESLKSSPLIARIAQRRDRCGDIVLPKGYAGSLHPLLTYDELEKEVGWGLHNPWSTGVADLFGSAPDLLMPRLPDLSRESACALYGQMGFRSIGVPMGAFRPPDGEGPKPVPYVRIPDANGRVGRELLARRDQPLLLIDLSRIADSRTLDAVMDAAVRAATLSGPLGPLVRLLPAAAETGCAGWDGIPPGELRRIAAAAGDLHRRKRRKNEEYQRVLTLFAGGAKEAGEDAYAGGTGLAPRRRTVLAQMQGEVLLAGSDFDAVLAGGRFCGLTSAGRDVIPRRPAESYVTIRGIRHAFRTVSAFSFEAEGCSGLREELRLEHFRGASMSVDYFFLDGFPHLLIDLGITWPDFGRGAPVDACVPFGLRLFPVGPAEEVLIHGCGPDGDPQRVPCGPAAHAVTAVSSPFLHVVRGAEGVTFSFPTPAGASSGLVLFRVVTDGKGSWLEANPFGSWSPFRPDWTAGRVQRFSLGIGIGGATPPRKPPALPRAAMQRIAKEMK